VLGACASPGDSSHGGLPASHDGFPASHGGLAAGPDTWQPAPSELDAALDAALAARSDPFGDDLAALRDGARSALERARLAGAAEADLTAAAATLAALDAEPDAAFASLRTVEDRLPQTSELLVARLFESGRPAEATAALVQALVRWPERPPLHALARAWRDAMPDKAAVLAALPAAEPPSALSPATRGYLLLSQGIASMGTGDRAGAAELFERGAGELAAATADPLASEWELLSGRVACHVNAGWMHYEQAQEVLAAGADHERCIELAPDNARYVNDTGLILLYHLERDLDRAEELFRRAIALGRADYDNPFADETVKEESFLAFTDAMLNLATLHLRLGQLDAARAQCDELLAIAPDRPDALQLSAAIPAAPAQTTEP
jgi:tetratricopeptide (TPR) repeat protein